MTEARLLSLLREIFESEFEIEGDAVVPEARLREDLDLDSIDAVSLAARLENETGAVLKEEKLRSLRTVGDVVALLQGLPLTARA
jgi:acyl carrier protein